MKNNKEKFDLLTTVQQGGCSAKLPPQLLNRILEKIEFQSNMNLIVDASTQDDAAVWKLNEETAIIYTTDFFPPVCSEPYQFGQISAANALSDIYAMGGEALTALNIVMFPSDNIDISVLTEILKGGSDKAEEAGIVIAGGHTIDDYPPKYGLAVIGKVHPDKIITNDRAKKSDVLILTKPLGTATIIAGKRLGEVSEANYTAALESMKLLNKKASELMQKYNVQCATDVTGFSLTGHALEVARASNVTVKIETDRLPLLQGAYELTDMACIPGASFRNLKYVEDYVTFKRDLDYNMKMLTLDAQTSGGLLIFCPESSSGKLLDELKNTYYPHSSIIGEVVEREERKKNFVILD